MSDPAIIGMITFWKQKLAKVKYSEMDLADQGEIDHFIQTSVLKWNEVERERRMRDPMFVLNFEKVRNAIFPDIVAEESEKFTNNFSTFKQKVAVVHQEKHVLRWKTSKPFYYEDYVKFFNILKNEQNPRDKISILSSEMKELTTWVTETLAVKDVLESSNVGDCHDYVKMLKANFFPMLRDLNSEKEYEVPNERSFRMILYENQIGYKRDDSGKLFVKRFYRIPSLLFPEVEQSSTEKSILEYLSSVSDLDEKFIQELAELGFDGTASKSTKRYLHFYIPYKIYPTFV